MPGGRSSARGCIEIDAREAIECRSQIEFDAGEAVECLGWIEFDAGGAIECPSRIEIDAGEAVERQGWIEFDAQGAVEPALRPFRVALPVQRPATVVRESNHADFKQQVDEDRREWEPVDAGSPHTQVATHTRNVAERERRLSDPLNRRVDLGQQLGRETGPL